MTREWLDAFILWHESRLTECGYSREVADELRRARNRWLSGVK